MLQGRVTSVCVNAKKASAADVTPAAVDWTYYSGDTVSTTTMLQITGITASITLRVNFTADPNALNQKYSVQSTASFGTGTAIANNGTFTVSNGQYLGFSSETSGGFAATYWTITNVSDGNAAIDTFQTTPFTFGEEDP
jgi:hypothetical protein